MERKIAWHEEEMARWGFWGFLRGMGKTLAYKYVQQNELV